MAPVGSRNSMNVTILPGKRTKDHSAQSLAGSQGVARQELLRVQAPSAFALDSQNFQSIAAATDHQAAFVRLENLAGLARNVCDSSIPDFEQARLRACLKISKERRVCGRKGP